MNANQADSALFGEIDERLQAATGFCVLVAVGLRRQG